MGRGGEASPLQQECSILNPQFSILNSLWILAVLCLVVVLSEWLVRRTFLRHLGTALLAIILTAIVANIGVIPAGSTLERPVTVYDGIFTFVAPLAIFWLVLPINLRSLLRAGVPMLVIFLIGSAGTAAGVFIGMWVVDGAESIGSLYGPLGGMFAGTYIGGSVNFNAVALHYDVVRDGVLYGGAVVVDNIATTVWMIGSLALPRLLHRFWRDSDGGTRMADREVLLGIEEDTETLHPVDVSLMLGLGFASLWISETVAAMFEDVPMILVLTIVASQSNIGGSTSSLAIARSLGREDLVLPGILTGLFGNALGTFVGFWVAAAL